eukprot:1020388-Prymnesium_polylepis.1
MAVYANWARPSEADVAAALVCCRILRSAAVRPARSSCLSLFARAHSASRARKRRRSLTSSAATITQQAEPIRASHCWVDLIIWKRESRAPPSESGRRHGSRGAGTITRTEH